MTGDNFIPDMHFNQPEFTYRASGPFTKHYERIQILREARNLKHLHRNELDKAFLAHDAAYSDSKHLAIRAIWDKVLKDIAYIITINPGYDGYQKALASMVYKLFDKKTGSVVSVNEQLAEELHKPVIKKFKGRKVYARFKDNIWAIDLAKMELMSLKKKS